MGHREEITLAGDRSPQDQTSPVTKLVCDFHESLASSKLSFSFSVKTNCTRLEDLLDLLEALLALNMYILPQPENVNRATNTLESVDRTPGPEVPR